MRALVTLFIAATCWAQADLEAVIETDAGTFRMEFAPDKAPKHVEHFIKLAREGYYDGGAFHRTIAYGIIQGGDPLLKDPKTPRKLWGTGGLSQLACLQSLATAAEFRGVLDARRGYFSLLGSPSATNP